jgi:transposase
VHVPEESCEALRALLRAREDARRDQHRARQRLNKFLLAQGRIWPRKKTWTQAHVSWIEKQHFDHPALDLVPLEYLQAVHEETDRVERFDTRLAALVPESELAALVEALQAFRGIKLLSAATIAFELVDLRRFPHPKKLMSFCGVVPGEDSTGERIKRTALTKAGNKAVRRILTEVAWNYRFKPAVTAAMRQRSRRGAPGVKALAWKAQLRLHGRYVRLKARGKSHNKVLVSVARELLGFIWAVGQEEQLLVA